MANIRIKVTDPGETEVFYMRVPNDVPVGDLRDAMVDSMELPLRGQRRRRLHYHLSVRNPDGNLDWLDENNTLEDSEVQDGDPLQLVKETLGDESPSSEKSQEPEVLTEGSGAVLEKLYSFEERVGEIENKLVEVAGAFDTISSITFDH